MPPSTSPPQSGSDEAYRQAGVDLKKADAIVDIARSAARKTDTPHIKTGIGGFSGAFEIPAHYKHPVLLTGCDGVGTKLKLATLARQHTTIGIDLVAMSVNDVLVNGGEPLVFLDYYASASLDLEQIEAVINSVAQGCKQAGCVLAGGETAEMPGFYPPGDYDVAGFCVGVAEKANLYPKPERMSDGDVIIGLTSSGLHSNGYSLARKIFLSDADKLPDSDITSALLAPTQIYVKPVLQVLQNFPEAISAMAHITGGGFYDNIPRVLPENFSAQLNSATWRPHRPRIFDLLQQQGQLDNATMWHTFNDGIGYVLVAKADMAEKIVTFFNTDKNTFKALMIGQIQHTPGVREVVVV